MNIGWDREWPCEQSIDLAVFPSINQHVQSYPNQSDGDCIALSLNAFLPKDTHSLSLFSVLAINLQRKGCFSLVCLFEALILAISRHLAPVEGNMWMVARVWDTDGYNKLRFPHHPLIALSFFLLHLEIASCFHSDHSRCQESTECTGL